MSERLRDAVAMLRHHSKQAKARAEETSDPVYFAWWMGRASAFDASADFIDVVRRKTEQD